MATLVFYQFLFFVLISSEVYSEIPEDMGKRKRKSQSPEVADREKEGRHFKTELRKFWMLKLNPADKKQYL